MLHDKIKHYEESGQMLKNTPAQYKNEHEFLKKGDTLALANAHLLRKVMASFIYCNQIQSTQKYSLSL
jgi:putative transposase